MNETNTDAITRTATNTLAYKTQIILHRVNTLEGLKRVPKGYGVEIDIRGYRDRMLLSHDPIVDPSQHVDLETYLREISTQGNVSFLVFNMKEAGYEQKVIDLASKYGIAKEKYFLLDVEFPYVYRATRTLNIREIAIRYSEVEPIEAVELQIESGNPLLDWVWIDTNTKLPLDESIVKRLAPFKTCLVSPDRWGRPQDIAAYAERIKALGMKLDAVMTGDQYIKEWDTLLND